MKIFIKLFSIGFIVGILETIIMQYLNFPLWIMFAVCMTSGFLTGWYYDDLENIFLGKLNKRLQN